MKRSTKLFALLLCALLLLPGLFACKPQTDDPSDTDGTTEQPSAEQTTELPTEAETEPPIDPAVQNQSLITEQAFLDPAREYRALKIEHNFASLPGASWEEKAQSLIDYGFGGAACNMKWDENYLQPGQSLNDFAAFVDAAHKQDIRIWLYDEYGYPSGSAGNLTVKDHPEYAAVRLVQHTMSGGDSDARSMSLPDGFVKVEYAYLLSEGQTLPLEVTVQDGKMTFTGVDAPWTAYIYCVAYYNYGFEWNSSYPNILNRDAVARFIEVTFDTYEGAIPDFANAVEAIFDDEAQLLAAHHLMPEGLRNPVIPYDYDIFDTFLAKYGYDLRPLLHMVYSGTDAQSARVRAHFYAHVGDLVAENFFGQVQAWAEAHGTKLSGHLLLEEQMQYHVPVYGNYIQCSKNMGYSGFDVLNVRPGPYLDETSTGGKYASSAAWLTGKDRVMIEIAPAANPDEFATNHLDYALGAMTFAYFDGGNQVTSYYGQANVDKETGKAFNEYVGRMGAMTTGAQNLSKIAVFYSVDAVAAAYQAPATQQLYNAPDAAKDIDKLVTRLTAGIRKQGLDYVFIDDASLQGGSVSAKGLTVGSFTFSTVIVPGAAMMDIESMRVLDALIEAGANVIFVETMPTLAFYEKDQAEMEQLSKKHEGLLKSKFSDAISAITETSELGVKTARKYVYVSPYEKNGVKFFFLALDSTRDADVTLSYEGACGFRIYDPLTGSITEVESEITLKSYRALFVQPLFPEQ